MKQIASLRDRLRPRRLIGVLAAGVLAASPAAAQTSPRRAPLWAVEIDYGAAFGATTPGGSPAGTLPIGATFTTVNGQPSRAIPSWYFGDGATLFNQVQAQFASRYGQQFPTIASLDDVLRGPALHRQGVASDIAFRVLRKLPGRFTLEFSLERRGSALALTDHARSVVEASRASFESALRGLINTIPQNDVQVSSTADFGSASGGQTLLTVATLISLVNHGKLEGHAIVGGGMAFNRSASLDATLTGAYSFTLFGTFPFNETDKVTMHFVDSGKTPIGIFGGGVTYALTRHQALRVDFRLSLSGTSFTTSVDASPSSRLVVPASVLPSATSPSIQFSTASGSPTSLSGQKLRELPTFTGSGVEMRTQLTFGYLVRF